LVSTLLALLVVGLRRGTHGRHARTMQLSLTLLRYDEGLGSLAAQTCRSDRWWEDVDPREQHLIDRALSMWDLAAWYVATGRVERRAVLDLFSWNIVDLWERAYPYVLHRRVTQPSLWAALTDLYVDAYDRHHPANRRRTPARQPVPARSITPDEVATSLAELSARSGAPEADAAEAPARAPAPAAAPAPPSVTDAWALALRKARPATGPRPAPGRRDVWLPPARSFHEAEHVTLEWNPPPAGPTRTESRRSVRPDGRASVVPKAIDQVIDLTEATAAARPLVGG
jgi:hypothetical protein